MLKKCTCKHDWQDKYYNGLRVVNKKKEGGYRCTVCGKDTVTLETKK